MVGPQTGRKRITSRRHSGLHGAGTNEARGHMDAGGGCLRLGRHFEIVGSSGLAERITRDHRTLFAGPPARSFCDDGGVDFSVGGCPFMTTSSRLFHLHRTFAIGKARSADFAGQAFAAVGRAMFATVKDELQMQLGPRFLRKLS